MSRRALISIIILLCCTSLVLAVQVVRFRSQLHRAEYFLKVGLLSVQRACDPVVDFLRTQESMTWELTALARGCLGQGNGVAEAEAQGALLVGRDPRPLGYSPEDREG